MPLEKDSPEILHFTKATLESGNPRRNIDITWWVCSDRGKIQIMKVFGVFHKVLFLLYSDNVSNDSRPQQINKIKWDLFQVQFALKAVFLRKK